MVKSGGTNWKRLAAKAQAFADCRCIGGTSKANNLARPISRWATKFEYWNAGIGYHLTNILGLAGLGNTDDQRPRQIGLLAVKCMDGRRR
jgi:hypothetical protein